MTDPAPFLSTIAASSAAMVAIIGGLLVAKFVALDSEQQGAQHLLDDAKERLVKTKERERQAWDALRAMDVDVFFNDSVLEKIYIKSVLAQEAISESDIAEFKRLGNSGRLTDEDIAREVARRAAEFLKAHEALGRFAVPSSKLYEISDWRQFKLQEPSFHDIELDDVWRVVYKSLRRKDRSAQMVDSLMVSVEIKPTAIMTRDLQRHEARRDEVDRTVRVVEDLEAEVVRLQKARDIIVRPKGLGVGLIILALFTLGGVIYPIAIMAQAPKDLTRSITYPVFSAFAGGLVLLLGYMAWLSLRLAGWFKKDLASEKNPSL